MMKIFLTGATGFIGSAITAELLQAGHTVRGLTRSAAGASALALAGAEPFHGDIERPDSLREGAAGCDGIIHTAFDHNFANFVDNCEKDRRAIEALGSALAGSSRLLLITSGTGMGSAAAGQPATENHFDINNPNPRRASEQAGLALSERGVHVAVMRLSQIHNTVRMGLVSYLIDIARKTGMVAYPGDGMNCWSAAHVSDTARLYRLAFEKQAANVRYHATAESAIPARDVAQAIGKRLGVPVSSVTGDQVASYFGWLSTFASLDMSASSEQTRTQLGWHPAGPGLLADIRDMA